MPQRVPRGGLLALLLAGALSFAPLQAWADDAKPAAAPQQDQVSQEVAAQPEEKEPVADEGIVAQDSQDEAAPATGDGEAAAKGQDEGHVDTTPEVHVRYAGHVQDIGWQDYVSDGQSAGTSGESKRVEALKIKLDKPEALLGGIEYRMHVENDGWHDWTADDAEGGTSGESKRVEAMQIRLYSDVESHFDVYYRVHAQDVGWMGWAKNGETAGTAGHGLRLEAVQIMLVKHGEPGPSNDGADTDQPFIGSSGVAVKAHVQNVGWQDWVGNGAVAGTEGQSLRVEALRVSTDGLPVPGGIETQAHVQNVGWQDWVGNGAVAGTEGQSLRVEALRMHLVGEAADLYDLYYRVHVANIGWMGWASEDHDAGTAGMSARIEAVQVLLVGEGSEAPSNDDANTGESFLTGTNVYYNAFVQDRGWQEGTANGGTVGTTGESLRVEAFEAWLGGGTTDGWLGYRACMEDGWQDWVDSYQIAGSTDNPRSMEAIQMALGGTLGDMYDVYYHVHLSGYGWLDWARNGEVAGAPGVGRSIEAIEVRLVPKDEGAPGPTRDHEVDREFFEDPMIRLAQQYSSPTDWLILVDCTRCKLGIFTGWQGDWRKVDIYTISCGAPQSPSRKGIFSVGDRGYSFGAGSGHTCYYWVQWYADYLFHSIIYYEDTFDVLDGRMGQHVSAGCIRQPLDKAKWLYENIPSGTTVVTYD